MECLPDGRRIAFMAKSFGDAFVVDVRTKMIRLLTQYPNPGFLRVQYLPNGDFFLIGARTFTDIKTTQARDQEMWVLKAGAQAMPVALEHKISEGVALSRKTAKIAWSRPAFPWARNEPCRSEASRRAADDAGGGNGRGA